MFYAPPNQTDYTTFLQTVAGITAANLPITSQIISDSLAIAQDIVNLDVYTAAPDIYVLMVYNFGTDWIINYAIDQTGQTYFTDLRQQFNITSVSTGLVSSSSDQGTSVSILNPEQMKEFTLQHLQMMKTPFGRQYMALAQAYGPALWGLT